MNLSSCSTLVVKTEILVPPEELTSLCPHKEFTGTTQRDLALWTLHLEKQLELCNLKQEMELQWFHDMQLRLGNEG